MYGYDASKHCPVVFYGGVWRQHQPERQWSMVVGALVDKLTMVTEGLSLTLSEVLATKPELVTRRHVDELYARQEDGDVILAAILALGWHSIVVLNFEAFKQRLHDAELYSKVLTDDEQAMVGGESPGERVRRESDE